MYSLSNEPLVNIELPTRQVESKFFSGYANVWRKNLASKGEHKFSEK